MGALLVGIGLGVGLAVWSQRPALVEQNTSAFVIFMLLVVAVAWWGGARRSARATAVAVAQARAEARAASASSSTAGAHAAVNVFVGGDEQREPYAAVEEAEWYGERAQDAEVVAQLEERGSEDGVGQLTAERGDEVESG